LTALSSIAVPAQHFELDLYYLYKFVKWHLFNNYCFYISTL